MNHQRAENADERAFAPSSGSEVHDKPFLLLRPRRVIRLKAVKSVDVFADEWRRHRWVQKFVQLLLLAM